MTRKRTVLLSLTLLGTLIIGVAGVVGCHRGPMIFGGGCGGEAFPKHVLEKVDSMAAELELNAAQQERYRDIRARVESEMTDIAKNRRAFFMEIKTEMDKDSPDLYVAADLLKDHGKRFPERMTFFVDQFMDFYGILDAGQKEKVATIFRDKFKKLEALRAIACE